MYKALFPNVKLKYSAKTKRNTQDKMLSSGVYKCFRRRTYQRLTRSHRACWVPMSTSLCVLRTINCRRHSSRTEGRAATTSTWRPSVHRTGEKRNDSDILVLCYWYQQRNAYLGLLSQLSIYFTYIVVDFSWRLHICWLVFKYQSWEYSCDFVLSVQLGKYKKRWWL